MKTLLNPAGVDFVTLKLFCSIVQSGSITKGANECNLALSAASRRISEFEETVGVALTRPLSKRRYLDSCWSRRDATCINTISRLRTIK
ncbi:LysR family transcriptional regulator [Polynucleobacter necessarius]|uniref:helix-turn-helix domain-containing protein n=1 Tax=Polynucleobacter necessarius TaxID=576610 RepID=UPI002F91E261